MTLLLIMIGLVSSCHTPKGSAVESLPAGSKGQVTQLSSTEHSGFLYSVLVGFTKDLQTHEPLPYVTVRLENPRRQYVLASDHEGRFKSDNLISGEYQLKLSYIGYHTLIDSIQLEPGHQTEYLFEMLMDPDIRFD